MIIGNCGVTWKLFHDLFKKDFSLGANLLSKKAPKKTNKVLHPGN